MGTKSCPKCSSPGRLIREGRLIQKTVSDFFEYYRCPKCDHAWMIYKRDPAETSGYPATAPKGKS